MTYTSPILRLPGELLLQIAMKIQQDIKPLFLETNSAHVHFPLARRGVNTLYNLALTCQRFTPVAQEMLLHSPVIIVHPAPGKREEEEKESKSTRLITFLELFVGRPALRTKVRQIHIQVQTSLPHLYNRFMYFLSQCTSIFGKRDKVLHHALPNLTTVVLHWSASNPAATQGHLAPSKQQHIAFDPASLSAVMYTEEANPYMSFETRVDMSQTLTPQVTQLRVGIDIEAVRSPHQCWDEQLHAIDFELIMAVVQQYPLLETLHIYDITMSRSRNITRLPKEPCSCRPEDREVFFDYFLETLAELCPQLTALCLPENWYTRSCKSVTVHPGSFAGYFPYLQMLTVPKCALMYNRREGNKLDLVLPAALRRLKITQVDMDVCVALREAMEGEWSCDELKAIELCFDVGQPRKGNKKKRTRRLLASPEMMRLRERAEAMGIQLTLDCA